jgi:hypothetical protein
LEENVQALVGEVQPLL